MTDPRIPQITGEAVMAAARVLGGDDPSVLQMDAARIALEAALPHLEIAPQPVVDREALGEWLYDYLSGRRGADSAPWSARMPETKEYWFKRADAVLALINGSDQ
jgi:hypothetical protein